MSKFMETVLPLVGTFMVYGMIGAAYAQFVHLRYSNHREYGNSIPPAPLLGIFWPIAIPGHIAIWFGSFIHNKTKKG